MSSKLPEVNQGVSFWTRWSKLPKVNQSVRLSFRPGGPNNRFLSSRPGSPNNTFSFRLSRLLFIYKELSHGPEANPPGPPGQSRCHTVALVEASSGHTHPQDTGHQGRLETAGRQRRPTTSTRRQEPCMELCSPLGTRANQWPSTRFMETGRAG